MSLFPLHKDELGDDQSDDEDEDHLCMHGFMAFVLGMHFCMIHPVEKEDLIKKTPNKTYLKQNYTAPTKTLKKGSATKNQYLEKRTIKYYENNNNTTNLHFSSGESFDTSI